VETGREREKKGRERGWCMTYGTQNIEDEI
jgi:hypothetical protein